MTSYAPTEEQRADFGRNVGTFLAEAADLITAKNADYAADRSPFHAFEEAAGSLDLPLPQVWAVYWHKHVRSIMNYCAGTTEQLEPIRARLLDAAAYLAILAAWIETQEPTPQCPAPQEPTPQCIAPGCAAGTRPFTVAECCGDRCYLTNTE